MKKFTNDAIVGLIFLLGIIAYFLLLPAELLSRLFLAVSNILDLIIEFTDKKILGALKRIGEIFEVEV